MRPKNKVTRSCEHCGKEFEVAAYLVKNGYGRFCGMTCYHAHRWEHSGKCAYCGEKSNTRFCTPRCQKSYWNKYGNGAKKRTRNWQRKIDLLNQLGGKCARCGSDDLRVLDIHHVDPSKKVRPENRKYNWSQRLKDWSANKNNLEVLCANCHRIHTWEQRGFGVGLAPQQSVSLRS